MKETPESYNGGCFSMPSRKRVLAGKVDSKRMEWALHGLGVLYKDQNKLAEAEAMYVQALQSYEEALKRSTHRHSIRSTT